MGKKAGLGLLDPDKVKEYDKDSGFVKYKMHRTLGDFDKDLVRE